MCGEIFTIYASILLFCTVGLFVSLAFWIAGVIKKTELVPPPSRFDYRVMENTKEHRYICDNCFNTFRTGKLSKDDDDLYDDICPNCGAPGLDIYQAAKELEEYEQMLSERKKKDEEAKN